MQQPTTTDDKLFTPFVKGLLCVDRSAVNQRVLCARQVVDVTIANQPPVCARVLRRCWCCSISIFLPFCRRLAFPAFSLNAPHAPS